MPKKLREQLGKEDRQCNRRTVLIRDMLEERKVIGEQQQKIEDRERTENEVKKRKKR